MQIDRQQAAAVINGRPPIRAFGRDAKAKEAKEDARDLYKAEMAKLQKQSDLAKAKLEEMQTASEDAWDTMVAEMEKVRDAFVHSFHYFKSQV